ncbi:AraC family transcriptional regulator [Arenibacter sp. S6351L]|uniref:AraC family transcriptional regulator n=1 Tax=Arenibacter sp. S6351L TaxID=2926407 RepID=UPI001FF11436|nr:AraC family transcriptional regulator [Arenibacter sp. S6351L]MCK0135456.1 AraC family transcriptional regulator [Arenibacter sp. S6351L]
MKPLYQKIEINKERLFVVKNNKVPQFDGLFHFHPEYELTYIHSGSGRSFIGDRMVTFSSGDLFFLGPNLPHSWESMYNINQPSQSLVIQLNSALWKGAWLEGEELEELKLLFKKSLRGLKFRDKNNLAVAEKMFQISRGSKPMQNVIEILSIFETLGRSQSYEYIASPAYLPTYRENDYLKINLIYNFVHLNFNRAISLSEVANLVNMTNQGFCRYFKKITRRTFFVYLNEYRTGHACRLLSEGQFNITEVGFQSGFQSISNFNKQFKLVVGCSPREYISQLG